MAQAPIVTIQLGQCGNQVGAAFFEQLSLELQEPPEAPPAHATSRNAQSAPQRTIVPPAHRNAFQRSIASQFFRAARVRRGASAEAAAAAASTDAAGTPLPVARAVLVDMEPKVIQQALGVATRSSTFAYDPKRSFYRQSGSGNNWAYGYARHGMECREAIMELVRREVECCSSLGGLLVLQSLAGGTGSGVGAFVSECIADAYPHTRLINQVVWPYKHGEVIVQNYNALLTLAHLHEYSDGILVFENDLLHQICARRLGMAAPSFSALNRTIARSMVSLVAPAQLTQACPFYSSTSEGTNPDALGGTNSSLAKEKRKARPQPLSDAEILGRGIYGGGAGVPPNVRLWTDAVSHLFAHPSFKLSTVRTVPQTSEASRGFSASSWRALLRQLLLMQLSTAPTEDGLDHSMASWSYDGSLAALSKAMGKQKFAKRFTASPMAASLYDPYTRFDAPPVGSAAAAAILSASVASATAIATAASAASASSSFSPPLHPPSAYDFDPSSLLLSKFDVPLAPPPYLSAYHDGEGYFAARRIDEELRRKKREATEQHTRNTQHKTTYARASSKATASAREQLEDDESDSDVQSYSSCLAQMLFLRGSSVCAADASPLLDPALYATFSLNPLSVARSPQQLYGEAERSATAWTNGQGVVQPLDHMLGKVYKMLHAEAYTHHYKKYGIEVEDMWQQVCSMEQVCADYRALSYQPQQII